MGQWDTMWSSALELNNRSCADSGGPPGRAPLRPQAGDATRSLTGPWSSSRGRSPSRPTAGKWRMPGVTQTDFRDSDRSRTEDWAQGWHFTSQEHSTSEDSRKVRRQKTSVSVATMHCPTADPSRRPGEPEALTFYLHALSQELLEDTFSPPGGTAEGDVGAGNRRDLSGRLEAAGEVVQQESGAVAPQVWSPNKHTRYPTSERGGHLLGDHVGHFWPSVEVPLQTCR